MAVIGLVVGGIAGLSLGIAGGLKWGAALREQPSWRYWAANAVFMLLGIGTTFVGIITDIGALWVGGIALMGGGITGLKYGLGKSVGVWRTVDNLTGTDDLPKG